MPRYPDNMDEMKKKLRSLKKLEIKIRFAGSFHASNLKVLSTNRSKELQLVWDEFFQIGGGMGKKARYSLDEVASLSRDAYKSMVEEYFYCVYYRYYSENGITGTPLYDPDILKWMGLSPDSGLEDIKKKFRELAKKYHPDTGGDDNKFIELMNHYNKLVE